ncbi:MAG: pimeloyl-ACP methyl ester carboxylesterase [Pseudohongiellaceae bacterium]|jgi:pimeloyl-ACP methyl ester carboxylesterase
MRHGDLRSREFMMASWGGKIILALLLLATVACHAPGHGPMWDSFVQRGRIAGEVSAEDGLALSFRGELPAPGEIADGPVLLLIHGWCGESQVWGPLDELPWSGHNVVSLDLAHHGASATGRADLSVNAFALDIVQLIDHLGLDETVLVGHGWGAQVALEAAALRPKVVRGVLAVEALHDLSQEFTVEQVTLMEQAFTSDFAGTMEHYLQWLVGPSAGPEVSLRLLQAMTSVPRDTALATLHGAFLHDVRASLVTLPAPLVLLNGDQRGTNLAALRELVPFACVELVPGAGHFPQWEQPLKFGAALDRALATIAALWEMRS